MPLRSKAQAAWMYANKPEMAKRWAAETPNIEGLPNHVKHALKRRMRRN